MFEGGVTGLQRLRFALSFEDSPEVDAGDTEFRSITDDALVFCRTPFGLGFFASLPQHAYRFMHKHLFRQQ